jgi:hypothetical protein
MYKVEELFQREPWPITTRELLCALDPMSVSPVFETMAPLVRINRVKEIFVPIVIDPLMLVVTPLRTFVVPSATNWPRALKCTQKTATPSTHRTDFTPCLHPKYMEPENAATFS